ncbi:hypothetical protein SO802_017768 [Lithocarpus litseifolius]|uniref:Uncharacterized protein n=1 Tax=Lithocarpus litseifolius TaxID=425828 RepID=A0AAW2CIX5_9ROSI
MLREAVKDGSSLAITPSSIPTSTTRGPDADLSLEEGSKEVLENSDEPVVKTRISDSNEASDDEHKIEAVVTITPEEPKVAAVSIEPIALILASPSPLHAKGTLSAMFEARISSTIVLDPVSEAIAFFIHFEQVEMNDLDPVGFWGTRPPYVNFQKYQAMRTLCRGSLLAVLLGRISLSCWGV